MPVKDRKKLNQGVMERQVVRRPITVSLGQIMSDHVLPGLLTSQSKTWFKEAIYLSFSKKKIKFLHYLFYAVLWGSKKNNIDS